MAHHRIRGLEKCLRPEVCVCVCACPSVCAWCGLQEGRIFFFFAFFFVGGMKRETPRLKPTPSLQVTLYCTNKPSRHTRPLISRLTGHPDAATRVPDCEPVEQQRRQCRRVASRAEFGMRELRAGDLTPSEACVCSGRQAPPGETAGLAAAPPWLVRVGRHS